MPLPSLLKNKSSYSTDSTDTMSWKITKSAYSFPTFSPSSPLVTDLVAQLVCGAKATRHDDAPKAPGSGLSPLSSDLFIQC